MDLAPYLVVGLGNPGSKYANTPHNIGFEVIDALAKHWSCDAYQKKFQSQFSQAHWQEKKVFLLKPQTYMNLSGKAVQEIAHFYKVPVQTNLLVVFDDLDLPPGRLRLRKAGGTGGHNGMGSIQECLGTDRFSRLRLGIGKEAGADADRLLSKIRAKDKGVYEGAVKAAVDAVEKWIELGVDVAMNSINARESSDGA